MPVKRRKDKSRAFKMTEAAIDAYRARDFRALHQALGLRPWEMSPLPDTPLGCNPANPPSETDRTLFAQSYQQAVELQRDLEKSSRT
ncbi:hypothetical protein X743_14930 [Mesorhizobium sp. LNHC252B00]|uniref:hypothetical protein n=1 Tax=Mesorhizobium sp. LNHC252B00 TaxID=1287252 RepID=UPI0003CF08F3|nr:hypothetical protein [Mesorhizobium sp. LNHC252B00]ESY72798.1 hypothetical protein X743_14930 [Mesorhizobium sp. LNHC252B00]